MNPIVNKIFSTSIVNLADLQKFSFNIPTYQRPYVWDNEQIEKMIGDFYKSFQDNKDKYYYIGTILTRENDNIAQLVDGQQRFTTLWLTAFVLSRKNKNSDIDKFLINSDKSLKMNFEIRTEVSEYFKNLLDKDKDEDIKIIRSSEIEKFPYLKNIAKALVTINAIIEKIADEEIKGFGDYIYYKVKLIKNTTPQKIDLNKLFSTINSAGVQLEQTDIVKANLLKRIDEKVLYSKIWESCENMSNFFERNVRDSFPRTDWAKVDLCNFNTFEKNIFLFEDKNIEANNDTTFTFDDFLPDYHSYIEDKKEIQNEERESEEVFCRSIINFGQLLLHTYRLHLKNSRLEDFEGTFHVNRLIEIFKPLEECNDPEEIKKFFVLLWKVRFIFDKYIVKWISDVDTKTEQLELININKNSTNYYTRTRYAKSSMLMLQSVMYFTGDYLRQYWLTSYLGYLIENHNNYDGNSEVLLARLEKIDNDLSLCRTIQDKVASYILIDSEIGSQNFNFEEYLASGIGTKFQHYWFQKLEYILWKKFKSNLIIDFENYRFESYRIVSRNSIEHIYPQKPENIIKYPKIDEEYLHSFGNLVLLSVSQNSEYSNKSFDEKKSIFNNKNNTYDTLNSFFIFSKYKWGIDEIKNHQKDMIDVIKNHYTI